MEQPTEQQDIGAGAGAGAGAGVDSVDSVTTPDNERDVVGSRKVEEEPPMPTGVKRHPSTDASGVPSVTITLPHTDNDVVRPVKVNDLAPHCCRVHGVEVRTDRPCSYYQGLLSIEECKAIQAAVDDRHATKAESLFPGSRSQFSVNDKALSSVIWERIKPHLPQEMDGGRAVGLRARWNHARYFPGQWVFAHMDMRQTSSEHAENPCIASRMSLTIYLDEGYEGCSFVFVKGLQLDGSWKEEHMELTPKRGDAVIFYQCVPEFMHAVPKLVSGTKSIMRSDVMYEFASPEEADCGGLRAQGGRKLDVATK